MNPIRTKQDLEQLITSRIEENARLEFKAAESLGRSEGRKKEITKDVSAFANAAGGVLIYGIKESSSAAPPRVPEQLDPIDASAISKEWLDQIIGQIQPRIPGVEITSIAIGPSMNDYAYVVDVPQGSTAHQALDQRYYRRRNFESTPMEDYEVRDVMHRSVHPTVDAEVRIIAHARPHDEDSHIAVRIKNTGPVMARHYAIVLSLPIRFSAGLVMPDDAQLDNKDGKAQWIVQFANHRGSPLFPDSQLVHSRKFKYVHSITPDPGVSISAIRLSLYADEMQKKVLVKSLSEAEQRWT